MSDSASPPPPAPRLHARGLGRVDSLGSDKSRARSRALRRQRSLSRRRSRSDLPNPSAAAVPPVHTYIPRYRGSDYPPPLYQGGDYAPPPYPEPLPTPYDSTSYYLLYQPPMPPRPPHEYPLYPASGHTPPALSPQPQPPSPDKTPSNPQRDFRLIEHRFAGRLFRIRTDAQPRSKKLRVKRVGDTVKYYCSGVLLTEIKYKLQGDIFHLYANPNVDRSMLPFQDKDLCSKIEILMACIVADLFESPWDKTSLDCAWGVSECLDIGDGHSLYVNVSRDMGGGSTGSNCGSLALQSAMDDSSLIRYRSEWAGPVVSQLDAFERFGSYDNDIAGRSHYACPGAPFERTQIIAALRRVELITAIQLGKRSYLSSSNVASIIGSKREMPYDEHVYGQFDPTVPTLFGLLWSKLLAWRRRSSSTFNDYDSLSSPSDSDSSARSQCNLEEKPSYMSVGAAPPSILSQSPNPVVMVPTGQVDGVQLQSDKSSSSSGCSCCDECESQLSGDDPFTQQDNDAADAESNSSAEESTPHLTSIARLSGESSEPPRPNVRPFGRRPPVKESHPDDGATSSDNKLVPMTVTGKLAPIIPSDQQKAVPQLDLGLLSPLPEDKDDSSVRNDQSDSDSIASSGAGDTASPRTNRIILLPPRSNVQTPSMTRTPDEPAHPSMQDDSFTSDSEDGDVQDEQDTLQVLEKGRYNEQDDADDISSIESHEGQTQAPGPKDSLDGPTPTTEKIEYALAHEHHDMGEGGALILPTGATQNAEDDKDDVSSSEDDTGGSDAPEPKSILRCIPRAYHRKGTPNQVQFNLPSPEQTRYDEDKRSVLFADEGNRASDEARRGRARLEERRKEWDRKRRDHTRGTYPGIASRRHSYSSTYPHTSPYSNMYSNLYVPSGTHSRDHYIPPGDDEQLSEYSAYKEAVEAGEVYGRSWGASQEPPQPDLKESPSYETSIRRTSALPTPPVQPAMNEEMLPAPATSRRTSRRHSQSHSRLTRRSSGFGRKSSFTSTDEESGRTESSGYLTGKNRPTLHVAKEIFTVIVGCIILILSILTTALDPAGEENWFKRIEEGVFVMFSLGIPLLITMRSRLSDNLDILLPSTRREIRSLRDLQGMNKGIPYDDFVKQLQKAILLNDELSELFSFKNASFKLSRRSGKLVLPVCARYNKTFKDVWFFGEELAFNKILGQVFRYRHENNVLYIEKDPVDIDGVILHVRRRLGDYTLGSAPENC